MGHYLSEMEGPPFETIEFIDDLKRGEQLMKEAGYWRKGGKCIKVTLHNITGTDRRWYEILCEKDGNYFITVSIDKWNSYDNR